MPGCRTTHKGYSGNELRPEFRHNRGIQILGSHDRQVTRGAVHGRSRAAPEDGGHPLANITNVSRASAEVFIVQGSQNVRLLVRCSLDRLDRGETLVRNRRQGLIHKHRITSKQCLRLEDRGDVSPGSRSRLLRNLT